MKYLRIFETTNERDQILNMIPYGVISYVENSGIMLHYGISNNEIWYTSSDGNVITPHSSSNFGANIVNNIYANGVGIITFDGNVTSIGEFAFDGCSRLTSVTIPDSVTSIESNAFSYTGITSVTIPSSVITIGSSVFIGCRSLTSVYIPSSVTNIGGATFQGCAGLTSIVISDDNTVYDSRNNCNAIIKTSTNELIRGCETTIIPDSVTTIISGAFSGCSGLTSITIPNSVTSIGNGAFAGCVGLTSVTIGNSVTSIGEGTFDSCYDLISITSLNTTPPTLTSDYILPSHTTYTIYVPAESVDTYKAASYWSNHASQIQAM